MYFPCHGISCICLLGCVPPLFIWFHVFYDTADVNNQRPASFPSFLLSFQVRLACIVLFSRLMDLRLKFRLLNWRWPPLHTQNSWTPSWVNGKKLELLGYASFHPKEDIKNKSDESILKAASFLLLTIRGAWGR